MCNALLAIDPSGKEADPYVERLEFLKHTSDGRQVHMVVTGPHGPHDVLRSGRGRRGRGHVAGRAGPGPDASGTPARCGTPWPGWCRRRTRRALWYSTQATVLALKALLAGTSAPVGEGERRIVVKLGEQFEKEIRIPPTRPT